MSSTDVNILSMFDEIKFEMIEIKEEIRHSRERMTEIINRVMRTSKEAQREAHLHSIAIRVKSAYDICRVEFLIRVVSQLPLVRRPQRLHSCVSCAREENGNI